MNFNERKFNTDIAFVCGLREAVIADFIRVLQITSDETTYRHGRFWVKCTQKIMTVHLPFLTEDMVQHSVRKLVDKGIIKVGVFDEDKFDHTRMSRGITLTEAEAGKMAMALGQRMAERQQAHRERDTFER